MGVRVKPAAALTNFTGESVNVVNAAAIARASPPVTGSGAAPGGGCVWPTLWRIGTTQALSALLDHLDVCWYAHPLSCKCRSPLEALSVAAIRVRGLALETRALASRALPARCYVDTASRDLPKAAFTACRSRSVTAVCSPAQLSVLLGSTHVHDPDLRGRIRRLIPPCQPGAREGASLLTSPWRRGHANANGPTAMLFFARRGPK